MNLYEYFDRISIIHLSERKDRLDALSRELRGLGIDIGHPKIQIPHAPRPPGTDSWPSRGVYGNFLSHLGILRSALDDNLRNVLVLEDDAIFSRRMCRSQAALVETLEKTAWDLCFLGHSLTKELNQLPRGFVAPNADFIWAHCYAVNRRVLPRLVAYLERATVLPAGHPDGARLYIDGAFTLFRRLDPDVITLISNPVLSMQKGSVSNLGHHRWYDQVAVAQPLVALARSARDQWWRIRG